MYETLHLLYICALPEYAGFKTSLSKHMYINRAVHLYLLLPVFACRTGFILLPAYPVVPFSVDFFVVRRIVFHFYFTELHTWKQSGSVCCGITYYSAAEYPSNW